MRLVTHVQELLFPSCFDFMEAEAIIALTGLCIVISEKLYQYLKKRYYGGGQQKEKSA